MRVQFYCNTNHILPCMLSAFTFTIFNQYLFVVLVVGGLATNNEIVNLPSSRIILKKDIKSPVKD
ncbi:hypothetical protein PPE03_10860 [Pseudoalteromonas peptidolytica]|nr:hypothetical protein PPE03_10860 [Pseudoalteromonas peptidolytica]